jgi:peptidoglycan/LPS O-acetylase OafA/YrhL
MFVFVLGWLAQHRNGWVVLAVGAALLIAGIAVFLAGFTTDQPLITRVGVFITGLAVVFAMPAVRARHSRVRKNPGREAISQS